jgi:hypothetical protein
MNNKTHPISRVLIRFYQRRLTRYTPECGRIGRSCSQLAAEVGLVAFITGHMMCAECTGNKGSSTRAARRTSGMGKTGRQTRGRR